MRPERVVTKWRVAVMMLLATAAVVVPPVLAEATGDRTRTNVVALIVDASLTYGASIDKAITRAVSLLDGMSATRTRSWDPTEDRIVIIALDALPSVLWEGSLDDLKRAGKDAWTARFQARTDFAHCTDVAAAFRLALRRLGGDKTQNAKYLFVFSDLLDEPPSGSPASCARARSVPPEFPWKDLEDVSVRAYWVPPEQTFAWRREAEAHGLEDSFQVFSTSESDETSTIPPAKIVHRVTDSEREVLRSKYLRYMGTTAKAVGAAVVAFAALSSATLGTVLAVMLRRASGRSR